MTKIPAHPSKPPVQSKETPFFSEASLVETEKIDSSIHPKPVEIRLKREEKQLQVTFTTGECFTLSAELLRYESPSAENKGHGATAPPLVGGRRHVGILNIEPIGHYALRIVFDDLHDTGIYSWEWLYTLGKHHDSRLAAYIDKLTASGLSRDP